LNPSGKKEKAPVSRHSWAAVSNGGVGEFRGSGGPAARIDSDSPGVELTGLPSYPHILANGQLPKRVDSGTHASADENSISSPCAWERIQGYVFRFQ
jgi:hypothetical protein